MRGFWGAELERPTIGGRDRESRLQPVFSPQKDAHRAASETRQSQVDRITFPGSEPVIFCSPTVGWAQMYMILMPLSIFKLSLELVPRNLDVESGVANQ